MTKTALLFALLFAGACRSESKVDTPATTPASSTSPAPSASAVAASSTAPKAPPKVEPAIDAGLAFDEAHAVWSPDRKLAITLVDLHPHVWDGTTRAHLRELDESMVNEALFSPDGKTLYLAHESSVPSAIRDPTGKAEVRGFDLVKGIAAEGDRGTGMHSLSADGAWLLARCNTVQVCLYNTKTFTGRMWVQPQSDGDPELRTLAFDAKDKRIVVKNAAGATYELEVPSLRRTK